MCTLSLESAHVASSPGVFGVTCPLLLLLLLPKSKIFLSSVSKCSQMFGILYPHSKAFVIKSQGHTHTDTHTYVHHWES